MMPEVTQDRYDTPTAHTTQRRKDILAAARKVFNASGYAAATVDSVAAEAGLSKGSVYNYFRSKQDLFKQVFMEDLCRADDAAAVVSSDRGAAEKLQLLLDQWFERIAENQRIGRLVLEYWATAAREEREGEMTATLQGIYNRWRDLIRAIVVQGIENGEFADHFEPQMAAALIVAIVDGVGTQAMLKVSVPVDQAYLAALKRAILTALTGRRFELNVPSSGAVGNE